MNPSDEQFWQMLRRDFTVADAAAAEAVAAAERLLADLDEAALTPLADAQIDAMVRAALVTTDRGVAGHRSRVAPTGVRPWPLAVRRFAAAALALLLAPKALAAVALVSVAAMTTYMLQRTTQTLAYQDAVRVLLSEHTAPENRRAAQGTVYCDLVWSIGIVREVAADAVLAGPHVGSALQRLRDQLAAGQPLTVPSVSDSLLALAAQVRDPELTAGDRRAVLERLVDLMLFGLSALQQVRQEPAVDVLHSDNRVLLAELARLLE
jgi:hypothetical protein